MDWFDIQDMIEFLNEEWNEIILILIKSLVRQVGMLSQLNMLNLAKREVSDFERHSQYRNSQWYQGRAAA